jgi:3-hydroxybutyryl-CoA dehydrogenase
MSDADMTPATKPLPSESVVAVAGAGTMGAGIALVAATAGHGVLLYDAVPDAADRAIGRLAKDLAALVQRGKVTAADREARLSRLKSVRDVTELAPAGLVIEAIVERLDAKTDLFRKVEAVVAEDAILATNTSSLSVTALAAQMRRPGNVVGMHFFNPAPILPLVEVVSGRLTDRGVAETIFATARAWGKTPVHCTSTPGFIVNRVARPFYGEALRLLSERAGDPATLDAVMRDCGGFRMGPFELMDLIGHDVNYAVTASVYEAMYQDPRYKPSLIQKDLVDAGLLGRKSGRGFYDYAANAVRPAPADAAPASAPAHIVVTGDLGPAVAIAEMAQAAGIAVDRRDGVEGAILIGDLAVTLTDGRSSTERAATEGRPTIVFDLALDYVKTPRIAIARADSVELSDVARAAGFFQAIGKSVSVLDDVPGLAVMRTVAMLANEAADVVHQGVASAADVDLAMMRGVNYPLGPLAWADRVGIARIAAVLGALGRCYGEDRYRLSPLLARRAVTSRPFNTAS